jgi:DNA-directed RNA polymerase subunit RPC12/RpoP
MAHSKQVEAASNAVRKMWEKHGIKHKLRFAAFCLSILPIPVISTAASALDRHLGDIEMDKELARIWEKLKSLNDVVETIPSVEDAVAEIAALVATNAALRAEVDTFLKHLGERQEEFRMLTEGGSYQQLLDSLVVAESAYFEARTGSRNDLLNSVIKARKTILHATDASQNYVKGTRFEGPGGAMEMHGLSTSGHIELTDSTMDFYGSCSIDYGHGCSVTVTPKSPTFIYICPNCKKRSSESPSNLKKYDRIVCCDCGHAQFISELNL